ncbi:hypothetical protein ACN2XU_06150 [Primorskyibacter sp. 2E107]|uniref:hypothetical protein n=1 Tax=Primorskyibacter sp. 2E107 TaxID=3403458 RepID=UPI003AF73FD4
MVPDFALSLSFEGIALLRHVNGRWARLSEVALDEPDLDMAVVALREQALALDPEGGSKVVLVIPNEQIRYLDTPDPGGDAAARDEAIRTALAGATPYAVSELVYDHTADRGRLLVAAVARETLEEAEDFARNHGFEGVSHAAIAPADAFKGAVYFGKVKSWKGRARRLPEAIEVFEADEAAFAPVLPAPPAPDPVPDTAAPESSEPVVQTAPEVAPRGAEAEPESQPVEAVPPQAGDAPQSARDLPASGPATDTPDAAQHVDEPEPKTVSQPQPEDPSAVETPPVPASPPQADTPAIAEPEPTAADPEAGANVYFSTIRAVLDDAGSESKPPEAPRAEIKSRFTPVATPDETVAETAPETPAPATSGPAQPPVTPKAETPLTARDRAVALAARAPRSEGEGVPAPKPVGADAGPKSAGITSGMIEAAQPAPRPGRKSGAAAAAARFLSRRKNKADTADRAAVPVATSPELSAKPFPKAPAPKPASPSVRIDPGLTAVPPESGNPGSLGKMAAAKAPPRSAPGTGVAAMRTAMPNPGTPIKNAAVPPAPSGDGTAAIASQSEADRMTIFGARGQDVGGKPRFLGLMLTATLLLFLAGVAAWASVFLHDGLAGLFRDDAPEAIASLPEGSATISSADPETGQALAPAQPASPEVEVETTEAEQDTQLAALDTLDDSTRPTARPVQPIQPQALTADEAAATYAATGYWLRAPTPPRTPPEDSVDQVYAASIDPVVQESDAVALPQASEIGPELAMLDPGLPPPAGMTFDFDPRGLIRATPEGALTPDGLRIYTGLPPAVPPRRPNFTAPESTAVPETGAANPLRETRPEARPDDIVEQRERATQTGLSTAELAGLRPVMRPRTEQEAAVDAEPESPATEQAVTASLVPVTRPRNMSAIVEQARTAAPQAEVQTASAAAIAPRTVQPSGTTAGSVARSATVTNAINLSKVSLIGIYGTPSNRRALVRLPSGSYKKVQVGDRIDGGRVAAIGESELRYTKSGRNLTLKMPRG